MKTSKRIRAAAIAVVAILAVQSPVSAGPREDAQAIVDKMVNAAVIKQTFRSIAPLVRQAFSGMFTRGPAKELGGGARKFVIDHFLASMETKFETAMRAQYVQIYQDTFTPTELAEFRAFLETPAGQGFAKKQALLIARGSQAGQKVGGGIGAQAARDLAILLKERGETVIRNPADLAILRKMFPAR